MSRSKLRFVCPACGAVKVVKQAGKYWCKACDPAAPFRMVEQSVTASVDAAFTRLESLESALHRVRTFSASLTGRTKKKGASK